MKKAFALIASMLFVSVYSQVNIFHKKYYYNNDIFTTSNSATTGNFIYSASGSTFMQGMFSIQKTDLAGNWKVTKTIFMGTSVPAITINKIIAKGANLYLVGSTKPGALKDGFLAVVDTALNSVYYRSYGTTANDEEFNDIIYTSNNELVMVGLSSVTTGTISVPKYAQFVVRANSVTGAPVYQKILDDNMSKTATAVYEDVVNNNLYVGANALSVNATAITKLTNDNLGNVVTSRIVNFPSTNMAIRKIVTSGNKLFMLGGDASNNFMSVETDLNLFVMSANPVIRTNFKYGEVINKNKMNYAVGLTVPTGSVQYLAAMSLDSLMNLQNSTQFTLASKPVGTNWYGANVLSSGSTWYWLLTEGWTSPSTYTNRYIIGSDQMLNATCNSPYAVTTQTTMQYNTPTVYTVTTAANTSSMMPIMMNSYTPTVTTLCSVGIENVLEAYSEFQIISADNTLKINSPYNGYSLEIIDLSGKLIMSREFNESYAEVDLNQMASGLYIVKLRKEGFEQRKKIIKQ